MLKPLRHVVSGDPPNGDIRTEDIRFSPSGRMLAAVATTGSVMFCQVEMTSRAVRVSRSVEFSSPGLLSPHGIEFLSEDFVAVANRKDKVAFFRVPTPETWDEPSPLVPIHTMGSEWFGDTDASRELRGRTVSIGPGSIRAHGGELFVCCNNSNTVTAHPFQLHQDTVETGEARLVARDGIEIPDGVALSPDGHWLAVSDHDHQRILVYRRQDGEQSCVLQDAALRHPHGLCFDPRGQRLFVADAGGRELHVFTVERDWDADMSHSAFRIEAVEADAFNRTREATPEQFRALEGGVKGIDIDPSGRILATTCRHQVVRFFQIRPTVRERLISTATRLAAPFVPAWRSGAGVRTEAVSQPHRAKSNSHWTRSFHVHMESL